MSRPYLWSPWATADGQPGRTAVVADDESCTFGELVAMADALAHGLHGAGVTEGSVVSTDIPTGPRFFALALAALRHGYGLFPVDRSLFASGVGPALLESTATACHVTDAPNATGGALPCPALLDRDLTEAGARHDVRRWSAQAPRAGHLLFATSGTTGDPQAVARTRPPRPYKGVAVADHYSAGTGLGPHLMANPTYHLGTLGPALYALQAGSAVVVQRAWSPDGFAELVDRHGADSAFLSPDRLLDVVVSRRAPRRRLRTVFHGGAACPPGVKRAAIELLGPVLHEYYGTSRGTLTEITTSEWLTRPGSVGRPLAGTGIDIREGQRSLPTGEIGEICARLRGIDRSPKDEPVLRTGDIGFLDEDGYVYVVGRAGTAHPLDEPSLEHAIRMLPGVTDVAVIGGDPLLCQVETDDADPTALATAIEAAAQHLGLPAPRIRTAPSGSLPRTPSGKIRRAAALTDHADPADPGHLVVPLAGQGA